jgi:hypothetical protein
MTVALRLLVVAAIFVALGALSRGLSRSHAEATEASTRRSDRVVAASLEVWRALFVMAVFLVIASCVVAVWSLF